MIFLQLVALQTLLLWTNRLHVDWNRARVMSQRVPQHLVAVMEGVQNGSPGGRRGRASTNSKNARRRTKSAGGWGREALYLLQNS